MKRKSGEKEQRMSELVTIWLSVLNDDMMKY